VLHKALASGSFGSVALSPGRKFGGDLSVGPLGRICGACTFSSNLQTSERWTLFQRPAYEETCSFSAISSRQSSPRNSSKRGCPDILIECYRGPDSIVAGDPYGTTRTFSVRAAIADSRNPIFPLLQCETFARLIRVANLQASHPSPFIMSDEQQCGWP